MPTRTPKLYSYIVARDSGFAPNPFHGFCTLACCKPAIRKVAKKGDYVIGLAGVRDCYRVIYAMEVTEEPMTFEEYWRAPRFRAKRPDVGAGGEKALGDNIYHWDAERQEYRQEPSCHSNPDGTENLKKKSHDTKDDAVLISNKFIYWGGQSPDYPAFHGDIIKRGPAHRCNFPQETVDAFIEWFDAQEKGCLGAPTNGLPSPAGNGKSKRGKGC